ncbi:hypothetical protein [Microbacterium sp. P04]|uniref:hypothetical protein n=1 Tax=Microbacterium sp. P04 TaxID=3366947 RepID=UPI003745D76F
MPLDADVPRRPATVTVAVIAVYIGGLLNTALGILILLSRYRVPDDQVVAVSLIGAALILLGLLTVAGGSSLSRGSALARGLLTAYLAALFALHVVTVVTTDWDAFSVVGMLAEAYVVVAVWTPPGRGYFRRVATTGLPTRVRAT